MCITAIMLKPSDEQCRSALKKKMAAQSIFGAVLAGVSVNDYTCTIEDHVFYKEIYTATGDRVGTAFLTQVIID